MIPKAKYVFNVSYAHILLTLWFLKESDSDDPQFGCKVNKV